MLRYKNVGDGAFDTIGILELLTGVKDRSGKPFVNEDGMLNCEPGLFVLQAEQNRKYSEEEIEDSVRKAFPTAKVVREGDKIYVSLKNGHKAKANKSPAAADASAEADIVSKHRNTEPRDNAGTKFSLNSEQILRSDEELTEELSRILKGAKNVHGMGDRMQFDLGNVHVTVNYADNILMTEEEKAEASKAYGRQIRDDEGPEGKVQTSTTPEGLETLTMTISRNSDPGVIFHKAYHIAKQFLSAREKAAMKRAADKALVQGAKNIRAGKEPTANGGIDPRVYKGEEAEAQIYRAWQLDRNAQSAKLIGRILTRIKDFASRLLSLFRENKGNVFRKIESGEVYNRSTNGKGTSETKFANFTNPNGTYQPLWKKRLERDAQKWSSIVSQYKKNPKKWLHEGLPTDRFKLMDTPAVMLILGAKYKTIQVPRDFIQHSARKPAHPGMTIGIVRNYPKELADPIMILRSNNRDNQYIFVLEETTTKGSPIVVPISFDFKPKGENVLITYARTSFGKNHMVLSKNHAKPGTIQKNKRAEEPRLSFLKDVANNGEILYINTQKSTALANHITGTIPNGSAISSALSMDNILRNNPNVKTEKDREIYQNTHFARYSLKDLPDGQVFDNEQQNRDAKAISDSMEIGSDQSMTKFSLKQKLQPRIDALKERIAPKLETGNRVSIAESTVDKLALPKQFRDYHVLGMVQSVSRYKDALTQQYFRWADTAKRTQAKLQGKWTRSHNDILDLIQSDEDTKTYTAILLEEDARKKVFSDDALRKEFHASNNVIEAHKKVRELLSDVRSEVEKVYSEEHVAAKNFRDRDDAERWAKTPFFKDATVQAVKKNNGWWWQVKYTTPRVVSGSEIVDRAHFLMMQSDQNVHILTSEENPDGTFTVSSVTKEKPLADVPGYIPHMFHDFLIVKELSGGGKVVVGSGTSVKEAVDKAKKLADSDPDKGSHYTIAPKSLSFEGQTQDAVVVGDKEYGMLVNGIKKSLEIPLADAEAALNARTTNRHVFLEALQTRNGARGWEQNMKWVIQHHISNSARFCGLTFKEENPQLYVVGWQKNFHYCIGSTEVDLNEWY